LQQKYAKTDCSLK